MLYPLSYEGTRADLQFRAYPAAVTAKQGLEHAKLVGQLISQN